MTALDRVRFLDEASSFPLIGTVTKVSPAGYVSVTWDDATEPIEGRFSPHTATARLTVVTGDDAKPRHDWLSGDSDDLCARCGAVMSLATALGPCDAELAPRAPRLAATGGVQ